MSGEPPRAQNASRTASPERYRCYQRDVARRVIVPFLREHGVALQGRRVLDVGCGFGGMMSVWTECGAVPVGVDMNLGRLKSLDGHLVAGDVSALPFRSDSFDFVCAHDCVEHVPGTRLALQEIYRVLVPSGLAFIAFPPFYGPYGGHQHGCRTLARFLPYGHLLPQGLWLRLAASEIYARSFLGLARLSMRKFENAAASAGFRTAACRVFLLRPEVALRWNVVSLPSSFLGDLPVVRELLASGVFYLVVK